MYVFGEGYNRQFVGDAPSQLQSNTFTYSHFDKVLEQWRNRVVPSQVIGRLEILRKSEEQELRREFDRRHRRDEVVDEELYRGVCLFDPYVEAKYSLFKGLRVAVNTAGLYGQRVVSAAVSESVIFAITDTGVIFSWGGRDYSWHEIQQDAMNQNKWRGDTTPRSQLLLGTTDKELPLQDEGILFDSNIEDNKLLSSEEVKAEAIIAVTKYYNVYEPPPDYETRMQFLEKKLLSRVSYDDIKFSLKCRGIRLIILLLYHIIVSRRLLSISVFILTQF